jgi:hypothetical protein
LKQLFQTLYKEYLEKRTCNFYFTSLNYEQALKNIFKAINTTISNKRFKNSFQSTSLSKGFKATSKKLERQETRLVRSLNGKKLDSSLGLVYKSLPG